MRNTLLFLLIAFLAPAATQAAEPLLLGDAVSPEMPRVDLISEGPNRLTLEFTLPALEVEDVELGGQLFQEVLIPGGGSIGNKGEPQIPTYTRLVAIPATAAVRIAPVIVAEEQFEGFHLPPVQGYDEEPFLFNSAAYQQNAFGPTAAAEVGDPGIMRDMRVVPLSFQPIRYNPADGTMRVAHTIRVEITFEGENLLNAKLSEPRPITPSFDRLYRETVVNYDRERTETEMSNGTYVIICPDDSGVISRLQPLLEWRERQGYPVRLATTSETGTSASAIKNWLTNAYNTWENPPEFVSLAGDATTPYRIYTWYENLSGYNGEGDHPYTTVDGGDALADFHIGRISFESTTELEAIVNKIVGYESTPYLGDPNWFNRGCVVGDDEPSGYSCVQLSQWVKERLIHGHGYSLVDTVWSDFVTGTRDALNDGRSIYSYRGYYGMSGWTNSNTYALQNGWEMPFAVILTCGTGSFASGTARSEAFLRANAGVNNPRAAIGSIGTATIGTHTRYNNCIHYGIFYGLLWEDMWEMGAALTRGKMEMYLQYGQREPNQVEIWSQWNNLMGDPAVKCWTGYPEPLDVTHAGNIAVGANAFTVTVEEGFGQPVEAAQVCLLKDGEMQAVGFTDNNGVIELPTSVASSGDVLITVTKHNYHPYLTTIQAVNENVYVGYQAHQIDDDSSGGSIGNNNGRVNPAETIELPVQLHNFGSQTATSVTATLTSDDPYVTVLDGSESYGNIAAGGSVYSSDDFDVAIDAACPHGRVIRFGLDVASTQGSWHSLIDLPIDSADLLSDGTILYNDGGNGRVDPGETVQLAVKLVNEGTEAAVNVTGTLTSLTNFVSVSDASGSWGTITVGNSIANTSDTFTISAASDVYEGFLASFQLVVNFSNGLSDTTTTALTIGSRSSNDPIGPDAYGYWAFDNTDTAYPEAPTYNWIEIDPGHGGSGTEIPLSDYGEYQDDSEYIALPFPFTYYGEQFTHATVCSNGWVKMGWTNLTQYRNWSLPAAGGPDGFLAVFWDDLRCLTSGKVYQWHDAANHRFIIQYSRVRNETGGTQNCEMILYDPAYHETVTGDGLIEFQYDQVNNNDSGDNYCTVGIESPDSQTGLTYTYSNYYTEGAANLTAGRAIRFVPIAEVPSGMLSGIVKNGSTGGDPLQGAEVRVVEADRVFVTGADGRYAGTAVQGVYTVIASHAGFEPDTTENVIIIQGQMAEVDFDLFDNAAPIISTSQHETTGDTVGPYQIDVTIVEATGLDQASLYYRTTGASSFVEVSLVHQGGDSYRAEIPGQPYTTLVQYYVYARDIPGLETVDPPIAPEDFYTFLVAPIVSLFDDDLEGDQGWTIGGPDDNATTGVWERVDPEATWNDTEMVQPEDDHTVSGTLCFVTDGTAGSSQGDFDVDDGQTTVTSPLVDLTSYGTVILRYYRWYSNDTGQAPNEDVWVVQATDDDGASWVTVESTNQSDRSWRLVEVDLGSVIDLTDQFRVRFIASDNGSGSLVEAAVDDIALILTGVVDVPDGAVEASRFALMPSRPNPTRSGAAIAFSLQSEGAARLTIYDIQGRTIQTLVDETRAAGPHSVVWDGQDDRGAQVPSGVYFYRLDADGRSAVKKMMRLD